MTSKSEIERRERLVQTYLIICGFLITYNQSITAQKVAMQLTFLSILSLLLYYIFLTKTNFWYGINCSAIAFSLIFSSLIAIYMILIKYENSSLELNGYSVILEFYIYYIIFSFIISLSLLTPNWKLEDNIFIFFLLLVIYLLMPFVYLWKIFPFFLIVFVGLFMIIPILIWHLAVFIG